MKYEHYAHISSTPGKRPLRERFAEDEMRDLPATNREVKLAARSEDLPTANDFALVSGPLSVPRADEVLVRNRYFVVSASLRAMIAKGAEDVKGVPFPALREGDTLSGEALGEIISSPPASGLEPGDLVVHHKGWRDYAAMLPRHCRKVDAALPDPVAHLGHGWTAYAALTRGTTIKSGDTVFVSSGAGAIGSMAGQIARLLGATRVVGSTSSAAKAARLVSELGYTRRCFAAAHRLPTNWRSSRPMASTFSSTMSAASNCTPALPPRARAQGS
jgi:NADPH-dependent curcumin reductase CurA